MIVEEDNMTREKKIQSGTHYSEMIPIEYQVSDEYLNLYRTKLKENKEKLAFAIGVMSEKILKRHDKNVVLVSLARAGTPIGILAKRYIKQRYNLDDLLVQLRDKGYRSIEEVEYAILESSGTLSIFPYENGKSPLPLPIILDGDIQEDTIKHLKKDKKWVYNFLDKKNINIEDVFFAFYKDKNIFIIRNDDLIK